MSLPSNAVADPTSRHKSPPSSHPHLSLNALPSHTSLTTPPPGTSPSPLLRRAKAAFSSSPTMEGPRKLRHVPAMGLLLLLFLLAAKSSPGEARSVVGLRAVDLSAAPPAVGVALPKESIGAELDHAREKGCSMAPAVESQELPSSVGGAMKGQKLAEEYGPLLLNLLPRGGVPPSAPSKGTNDIRT